MGVTAVFLAVMVLALVTPTALLVFLTVAGDR